MSVYGAGPYQPIVTPGMPMAGPMVPGNMGIGYGTPYVGNTLGMSGMSDYGGPLVDAYPPTIARTGSIYTPSVYGDRRSLYDGDRRSLYGDDYYDRDRYYDSDYDRGRRYYDSDDPYRRRRSSSRASRRSYRRDYDDMYYDRDYDRDYDYYRGDDYYRDGRYRSRTYSSSGYYPSRYYSSSSGSGRRREDLSIVTKRNGDVKVLRNGEERLGDRFRRMLGINPKGINVVRLKKGEQVAAHVRR